MHARLEISPYDFAAAARLDAELGCSHVLAQVLARRGLGEPEAARAFLAAGRAHPLTPSAGPGERPRWRILAHVERGSRITVHGDYDVDGVCSTAILVRVLRTLGRGVDWYLPCRIDDGYGLASATVERLAARGTHLLITVDCAVTAVDEVALAARAGSTSWSPTTIRRAPTARCPRRRSCTRGSTATPAPTCARPAWRYKLARALLERAGTTRPSPTTTSTSSRWPRSPTSSRCRREPRARARRACARCDTRKLGLRALMEVARVDPSGLDAAAIGFRLGPRLNAAGRLHRADAALELLLTEDASVRARSPRSSTASTRAPRRRDPDPVRGRGAGARAPPGPAYVLVGRGLAPGRDRHRRRADRRAPLPPAVLIALDGEEGTGSGPLDPAFDLLGGLQAGARHLLRHGGHRAAAGPDDRARPSRRASARPSGPCRRGAPPEDLVPVERLDAVAQGDALARPRRGARTARARSAQGNPAVSLLVPAATMSDPRALGRAATCVPAQRGRRPLALRALRRRGRAAGRGRAPPTPPSGWRSTAGTGRSSHGWCCASAPLPPARRSRCWASRATFAERRVAAPSSERATLGETGRPAPPGRPMRGRRGRGDRARRAASSATCAAPGSPGPRGPRRDRRAGAGRGRARAAPRARARRPRRRLRAHVLGSARRRSRPRRAFPHIVALDPPRARCCTIRKARA